MAKKEIKKMCSVVLIKSTFLWTFFFFAFSVYAQTSCFEQSAITVEKISATRRTEARRLIDDMYTMAAHNADSLRFIPKCMYCEAVWSYAQGLPNEALTKNAKEFIKHTGTNDYNFERALLHHTIALNCATEGSYADAFSACLPALQLFESLNDSLYVAKSLNLLGTICYHVHLYPTSYDYYNRALLFAKKGTPDYYHIRSNIYRNYAIEKEFEKSRDSLVVFIKELEQQGDTALLIISHTNLIACYSNLGNLDEAYRHCRETQNLMADVDNKKFAIALEQNFAFYYFQQGDYQQARRYFRQAIDIGYENNILPYLSAAYKNLSYIYKVLGNTDSAYFYLQKHMELADSFDDGTKAIAAYHAYISTFLESSANKLVIAEQEISLKNKQLILFIIFIALAVAVIIVVALLLVVAQQKRHLKEKENRELALQLEHEKEIQQMIAEKHRDDLASKTREITSYSLELSNKKNLLQEIANLTKQLLKKGRNVDEIAKKLNSVVKSNLNTEHELEVFTQHFDKVHPRFFDKLKSLNVDLTENNLKLCAYFRIGMSSKQIAQMLNISPQSVLMIRHRLRRKFGLGEDDNLDDFLRNI